MENALYVGLSRQIVLRREMDIIANNIANADTAGFKVESLMTRDDPQAPAFTLGGPKPVKFVVADGVARDFAQGALRKTDGPFDMAIEGQGFFRVQSAEGERFTRDGRFRTDEIGRLTTQGGSPVLDEGGGFGRTRDGFKVSWKASGPAKRTVKVRVSGTSKRILKGETDERA